jgi:hypothetical protein
VKGEFVPTKRQWSASPATDLKTTDAIAAEYPPTEAIAPKLEAFEAYLDSQLAASTAVAGKASARSRFPLRRMMKRSWIESGTDFTYGRRRWL